MVGSNKMARPESIAVSRFCDQANLRITVQPESRTVASGSAAGLSVTAAGATAYQWYRVAGSSVEVVAGQNTSTLTSPVTESRTFFVRVGNGTCTLDSARATVSVQACTPPDATITAPSTLTASTTATVSVPSAQATYAWTVTGGTLLAGSGTNQITVRASCSTVTVSVTVTNSCSSETRSHTIAVTAPQATVTGTQAIAQGSSAAIEAHLTGTGPWSVTWSDGETQSLSASQTTASRTVAPQGTTTYRVTALTDGFGCTGTASGSATVTVTPPTPTAVNAWATTATQVRVTWSFSGNADRFDLYRAGIFLASSTTTSYDDTTVTAATAYVYSVKAIKSDTASMMSSGDLATTVLFTDEPILSRSTRVKARHIVELQTAVNAVRSAAGLPPATFSSVVAGTPIAAAHVETLRTALAPARSLLNLPASVYERAPLASRMPIKASDINDTRGGVR